MRGVPLKGLSEDDLRRELSDLRDRYPKLRDDDLFLFWFLRAFVTDSDARASAALCGGPGDKNVDAVFVDEHARIVFVLQGKYRKEMPKKNEGRGDVAGFAQLAVELCGDAKAFTSFAKDMTPQVHQKLEEARNRITKRSYALHMFYVTMGKCSNALQEEAVRIVRAANARVSFQLFDGKRILLLLADYLDGVAPPVPSLDLEIEFWRGCSHVRRL